MSKRKRSTAVARATPSEPAKAEEREVESPPSRWRSDAALALGFGALAALVRVLFVLSGQDRAFPYTVFYEGDAEAFFLFARSVLEGTLYDNGIPFHPPGFAWFLAGLQAMTGAAQSGAQVSHLTIKLILATLVGGGTVAAIYLFAARAFGRPAAIVTAALCTFHFGLYILSVAPVGDGLFQLLLLVTLAILARALDFGARRNRLGELSLGAVLGLLALVRAEGILLAFVIVLSGATVAWRYGGAATERERPRRYPWAPWAVVSLVALLVVAPWSIRNAVRLGELEARLGAALAEPLPRFVPVTMYGPLNLALANHAAADGSFSRAALAARADIARLDLAHPEHLRWILHGDRMAREWMVENPRAFVRLVGRKWRLYAGALKLGWTQWNWPGGRSGVRRPVDIFVPNSTVNIWILTPLLLAGCWLAWAQGATARRALLLIALLTCTSLLVVALFFGYARLAVLLLPLWFCPVGIALSRAASLIPRKLSRGAGAVVLGLLGLLVAVEIYGAARGHRLQASGTTLPGRATLDRDQPIRFAPLPPPPSQP